MAHLVKLKSHEVSLLERGAMRDVTHANARARWLAAAETPCEVLTRGFWVDNEVSSDRRCWTSFISDAHDVAGSSAKSFATATDTTADYCGSDAVARESDTTRWPLVAVYRPMADPELLHLLTHGELPATQPYQAIMPGTGGREYADKYLNGKKRVDTHPSAVVEFVLPEALLHAMMRRQCKAEDGCMSTGLGAKAGRTVDVFNAWLRDAEQTSAQWGTTSAVTTTTDDEGVDTAQLPAAAAEAVANRFWWDGSDAGLAERARRGFGGTCRPPTAMFRIVTVKRVPADRS